MANAGGLQLLQQTRKKIEFHVPGQNKLLILSFVFLALVGGAYAGALSYRTSLFSEAQSIDQQLASLEQQRDKGAEERLLSLQKQLGVVGPLLSDHIAWSDALIRIQNLLEPKIQFVSFHADVLKQSLSIKAQADSYSTIAKQVAAFNKELAITDIVLNRITSVSTGKVEFDMELSFNRAKLLQKSTPNPSPRP